jgi:DNA-binding transcriptional ArsR family regulator
MHALDVLGDPVRRRILELLADGERSAGELGAAVQEEFGISQHLRVLRDAGFATVRPEGTRRLYAVDAAPLREVAEWVDRCRRHWDESFDALDAHLAAVQGKAPPRRRPAHRRSLRGGGR